MITEECVSNSEDEERLVQLQLSENDDQDEVINRIDSDLSDNISSLSGDNYNEDPSQDVLNDPILQSMGNKSDPLYIYDSEDEYPFKYKVRSNEDDPSLPITRKDVDFNLLSNIEKIEEVHKDIETSPEKQISALSSIIKQREDMIKLSIKNPISQQLLDFLVRDKLETTKDWYFITDSPTYQEPSLLDKFSGKQKTYGIEELYVQFGVCKAKLDPSFAITNYKNFDQMNNRVPVELMCDEILRHVPTTNKRDIALSLRYFILFILDRKVFESDALTMSWIVDTWIKHRFSDHLDVYLSLVPKDCYFLHHRFTRLLPIKSELIKKLFSDLTPQAVAQKFDELMDQKNWFQMLYFILFINGITELPKGSNGIWHYFRDCIYDMNIDNVSSIELSVLKSYINLCINST
ncbi:Smc5-Smc6 complex subunit KRE29 Ecym_1191 [Eremothecium cymbalariae DBVPG|uniref:Uncharacterized protein n=1 Tax=Eremothecium cymbalariae (strain CBS 270.75 / DBVPG 7215 / KCTC 17166 / NRRL Y-17582) TaxID=931890 RepID=G8JMX5_ERECY|nr:hypothetical protein Ecym_1191 [Eremothecium cymbalariae DBVPG\